MDSPVNFHTFFLYALSFSKFNKALNYDGIGWELSNLREIKMVSGGRRLSLYSSPTGALSLDMSSLMGRFSYLSINPF